FFSSRRRHTRSKRDWSSDVCSSDLSATRDQSYMLSRLDQDVLSRLILPLGEFEKDDVREMARDFGLDCADTPDSMEICFIPGGRSEERRVGKDMSRVAGQ